ncbi:hypothetical protein NLX83_01555 [Allokutzneria sp. A3M-2-11 16]|uniref:hypothetical protein n=1 Tax=Allokutzneria sp. A3M-2-11 16 TaxID=2962043 RepID=UPI0020B8E414|nr:hypothetical protein [Allokutzneria sp. A3M-2-11 16]MCP3797935.1 hypothetical protein [Allokutzneria sp. A3M-2-11 16]
MRLSSIGMALSVCALAAAPVVEINESLVEIEDVTVDVHPGELTSLLIDQPPRGA